MITARKVKIYKNELGIELVTEWIESLDRIVILRIYERIKRLRKGNLGDYKKLGDGLCELRMPFGPGYRIYFFEVNGLEVILLCGGSKARQQKDIVRARKYLLDYRRRML